MRPSKVPISMISLPGVLAAAACANRQLVCTCRCAFASRQDKSDCWGGPRTIDLRQSCRLHMAVGDGAPRPPAKPSPVVHRRERQENVQRIEPGQASPSFRAFSTMAKSGIALPWYAPCSPGVVGRPCGRDTEHELGPGDIVDAVLALSSAARLERNADWVVVASVSLPWSTSATVSRFLWLIAVVRPWFASVRREVMTWVGGLPVLLGLAALGMLCDVSWSERIRGLDAFHKLPAIPLLLAQFRRSDRARWVVFGFWARLAAAGRVLVARARSRPDMAGRRLAGSADRGLHVAGRNFCALRAGLARAGRGRGGRGGWDWRLLWLSSRCSWPISSTWRLGGPPSW